MSADGQEHSDGEEDSGADARTGFFGVIAKAQSYLNIVYLLLGLPLGTLYFTLLVTGFSVGVSLIVIALLGIPLLIGLWYVVRGVMVFERGLASTLLDVDMGPIPPLPSVDGGLWTRFKAFMSDGPTWRGIQFLLLRFPAGVATFTISVTAISVSVGLAFAPVYMWTSDDVTWGPWTFDPFPWSFALVPIGILLVFVSLHAMNALAAACGRWAKWSLGGPVTPFENRNADEIDLRTSEQNAAVSNEEELAAAAR